MFGMESMDWIEKITTDDVPAIARKSGVPKRTLYRQLEAGELSTDNIISIAEACARSPVRALVELGRVDARWVDVPAPDEALREASEDDLCMEIARRMKKGHERFDAAIDEYWGEVG